MLPTRRRSPVLHAPSRVLGWLLLAVAALACAIALLKAPVAPIEPGDTVPELVAIAIDPVLDDVDAEPTCAADDVPTPATDPDGCDRDWSCRPVVVLALDTRPVLSPHSPVGQPQFDDSPPARPPRALA